MCVCVCVYVCVCVCVCVCVHLVLMHMGTYKIDLTHTFNTNIDYVSCDLYWNRHSKNIFSVCMCVHMCVSVKPCLISSHAQHSYHQPYDDLTSSTF